MLLYELLEIINESAVVLIYDNNSDFIGIYDGKESIDEKLNDYEVMDLFPDMYKDMRKNKEGTFNAIGIKIDYNELEELEDVI